MKNLTLFLAIVLPGAGLFAQDVIRTDAILTPQFFIAIVAGVVLALAFQFALTALSVALGITMIGNVKENYVHSRVQPSDSDSDDDKDSGSAGVKISTGFGIWSTLTTCLAVFGGTALAMQLDIFNSTPSRITLALVIWGLFYLILFYLESKVVSTVVGGLVHAATAGLKSSIGTVKDMFTPSDANKVEHTLESAITKIRKEFDDDFDASKISGVLDNFLKKVEKKVPDYDKLKKDLKDIVSESSSDSNGSGNAMAIQQVLTKAIDENSDKDDDESKGKVAKLKELLEESKKAYDEGDGKEDSIKKVAGKLTGKDQEELDEKINQVKNYISKATPDSFTDEDLEKNIKKIFDDPKSILSVVSSNFKDFDKDSVVNMLSQNTSLDKKQLEGYADKISGAIQKITGKFDQNNKDSNSDDNQGGLKERAEKSIADYLNSTHRQELNYDDLKADMTKLIDNPKDSLDIISNRLSKFDSGTLRALVTNNKYVDESQIDDIMKSIEEGKKTITDKVEHIQTKARGEFKMLERKAVIQAEHTRKTAATAAWWLVASIVVSAGAAIIGGIM